MVSPSTSSSNFKARSNSTKPYVPAEIRSNRQALSELIYRTFANSQPSINSIVSVPHLLKTSCSQTVTSTDLRGRVDQSNPSGSRDPEDLIKSPFNHSASIDHLKWYFPEEQVVSYLTNECLNGEVPPSQIAIGHFIPEKIPDYENWLKEMLFEKKRTDCIKEFNQMHKYYGPQFIADNLKAEKQKEFELKIKQHCQEYCDLKLKAFHSNIPLQEALLCTELDDSPPFLMSPDDFDFKDCDQIQMEDENSNLRKEYLALINSLVSIFPTGQATSFLKKEYLEQGVLPSEIAICHFIPEKIPEYENWLKMRLFEYKRSACIRSFNQRYEAKGPQFTIDHLKKEKREEIDSKIERYCQDFYELRLKAFRNNIPLKDAVLCPELNYPLAISVCVDDFDVEDRPWFYSQYRKDNERYYVLSERLRNKLIHNIESRNTHDIADVFSQLDERFSYQSQIQVYLLISKELNKPIEDLNGDDLSFFYDRVRSHKIELEKKSKEAEAERIAQELLKEVESEASSKVQVKKKKGKNIKHPPKPKQSSSTIKLHPSTKTKKIEIPYGGLSKISQAIVNLNSKSSNTFRLHSRVRRWGIKNIDQIRLFKDFDPRTRSFVRNYQNCSQQELTLLRSFHQLSGIERLLSSPNVMGKYSYEYTYTPVGSNQTYRGKGLYCDVKIKNKTFSGIIYVGIGADNVIYHAKFEPLEGNMLHPSQMTKPLGEYIPSIESDEPWELASDFSYSVIENEKISFAVGKNSQDRVEYHIFPLN